MIPVVLRTARTVLDLPTADDVDVITDYCRDPLFERYLTTPWPYERTHATGWVESLPGSWREGRECTWAIREDDGAPLIGVVGITVHDDERPTGMIGFWLGAPHRGRGLLPEAATAVIDWAFDTGVVTRVLWEAVVPNRSSLEAARKLGFRYTGERDAEIVGRDGETPRSWQAELLADDDRTPKPGWP